MKQKIYLITGLMASGKSTVSDLLAKSIEKCVHLRGDVFRKMIISGRENMSATPSAEAVRQLYLRYKLTADAARSYFDNGFSVVIQDNYYGDELNRMINYLHGARRADQGCFRHVPWLQPGCDGHHDPAAQGVGDEISGGGVGLRRRSERHI